MSEKPLGTRERDTLLTIIGALMELLQDYRPTRADTSSQAKIIVALLDNYGEKSGIKQRTLEDKFAEANKTLARY